MKTAWILTAVSGACAAVVALSFCGCETESADAPVTISPSSVSLRKGATATFTASGGYEYTWSLSSEALGNIDRRTGQRVTYTAFAAAAENQQVVLTVTSTILGVGSSSTTNAALPAAEAYILHLAE